MSEWQETDFGKIPKRWDLKKIIELKAADKRAIAMGPFGSNIKAENFVDIGVPVIRGTNLNYAKYVDGEFVFLTEEKADELLSSNCKAGDLIFTHRGTIGQVGLIPINKYPRYVVSQSGMKLTVNPELIDNEFLFYFFKSDYGQYQILKHESQVGVPSISNPLTSLKEIDVPVPPLPEQLSIASILISLDDKIDLLHRQNETLEAMAETIFRQWFIEQAEDDWNMEPLDSIIDFNPRYKLSKGTDAIYLEMSNVSENSFHPKDWYIRTFASGTKFMNGDTLLARITPCLENGKTCFVYFLNDEEVGWGSTEYIVMRMKPGYHPFLSYIIAKNEEFRDFAESSMTGSSGRQRAQADVIKTFEIQIPPQPIIDKLNEQVDSIFDKLKNNATQIKSLESLRDTLLPKLMSGEVRVKN